MEYTAERRRAAALKTWAKPGYRGRQKAGLERAYADPKIRKKYIKAHILEWQSPERRAKQTAAIKAWWKARKEQQNGNVNPKQ